MRRYTSDTFAVRNSQKSLSPETQGRVLGLDFDIDEDFDVVSIGPVIKMEKVKTPQQLGKRKPIINKEPLSPSLNITDCKKRAKLMD